MNDASKSRYYRGQRKKRGSLSLEAALVMPMVLLITGLLIVMLICIEAQIKVKGALDRTALEISLLSPACQLFEQGKLTDDNPNGQTTELNSILQEICPDASIESILSDAVLDLASSALIGQIINKRLDYWLGEAWSGQPGWGERLGSRKLFLDWKLGSRQLWLCLSYELITPIGVFERRVDVAVPLWMGKNNHQGETENDNIWDLDNFSRGRRLRELYGANLPYDFPLIARFSAGEATAIKSMDMTAPTYQQPEEVEQRLREQITELAVFTGADYTKSGENISIDAASIQSRRLLLIIPGNCWQEWLPDLLSRMTLEAEIQFVTLEVVRHGNSSHYAETAQTP